MKAEKVVIVGGGFGGLTVARMLNGSDYHVLLIDRFNHHQFQPLLYQVALAGLEPSSVSFPLRALFQGSKNVRVRMAEVLEIRPLQRQIVTTDGIFDYDYLVLATGATTNFFGHQRLQQNAWSLKSTKDAISLRQHLLLMLEEADGAPESELPGLLTIVVAGGGPTGVELAGALAELRKHVLWRDYPELQASSMRIILVEAGDRLLAAMRDTSSEAARSYLTQMGVEVLTQTRVMDYDGRFVELSNGNRIASRTLIWTAGIVASVPEGIGSAVKVPGNRICVDRYCRMIGEEHIFVIGDLAYLEAPDYPKGHPQMAPVAIAQARLVASNLLRHQKGKSPKPFVYKNKGVMATIGKHKAVVDLPWFSLRGGLAWFIWMAVHLISLMGMKNRLFVFINWVIAYFTNDSTLRLIFEPMSRNGNTAKNKK
ncbi:MAG: NAD(P)/FAD-dependent oxidoreductase [Chitinophagales bacterium]|nr:NAD(P)/FAD-dependent oxidoreductase [Chitinophagales bacterium]MDW8428859.1 NAD(P)/FAD-dependent oxidoreductase [Chitinophagales bacterium]